MEPEKFLTAVPDEKILHILSRITKGQAMGLRQVCQRCGPGENEVLRDAYRLFLNRPLTCPRTLSNGDLLQCNAMQLAGEILHFHG